MSYRLDIMRIAELITKNRDGILRIAGRHGAREIRVFSSMARGEEQADMGENPREGQYTLVNQ